MSQNQPIFNPQPAFIFAVTTATAAGIALGFGWLEDNLDFPSFMVIGLAVNALIICGASDPISLNGLGPTPSPVRIAFGNGVR